MSCQVHVGILDQNGKLTKEAKENFISEVLLILEYGTENIPADKKPPVPYSDKIKPDPSYLKYRKNDKTYLRDEKLYSAFHKNWLGRYEKLAKDLNFKPNFSLLPAIADPIAIAGSGFNVEIPTPDFPGGFAPYFSGLLPQKLIGELVDAGEEKFLSPTGPLELVKTLIEKKSPPAPPAPIPPNIIPPPAPPGFSLPPPDQSVKLNFSLTPEQLKANAPKPHSQVLSDLSSKEFAAFENLPKALGEIIANIPSFLSKIGNPGEVVSEIGKTIKKAGVLGPEPKETSTLEKAAQTVLSSKIAEMSLVGALAVTIGSSEGSATTAITQKTSSSQPEFKYKPAPRKKPSKKKELTPAQKAYQKAIGLAGTSYGDLSKRTRYLEGLFYMEAAYRQYPADSLNVYGEFREQPTDEIKPIDNGIWKLIKTTPNGGLDLVSPRERIAVTPIEDTTGFFKLAEYNAGKLSSCGMFVRCCYQAAGAINFFFMSLYPSSTAVQVLQNIGLMRNYRWVSEDQDYDFSNPKDGKRAIMNDLYDLSPPDSTGARNPIHRPMELEIPGVIYQGKPLNVGRLEELLKIYAGKESKYNAKYAVSKIKTNEKGIGALSAITIEFAGDWTLHVETSGITNPSKNLMFLQTYLKPFEERAFLYNKEIGYMTINPDRFPSLEKGDALLITKTTNSKKDNDWLEAGEHVLLIGNDRKPGYKVTLSGGDTILSPPIIGIEGGSLDDDNSKQGEQTLKYDINNPGLTDKQKKDQTDSAIALLSSFDAQGVPVGDAKKVALIGAAGPSGCAKAIEVFKNGGAPPPPFTKENVSKGFLSLPSKLDVPSPTAILNGTHDLGLVVPSKGENGVPDNQLDAGLFLGAKNVARTKQLKNAESIKSLQSIKTQPKERRIIGIFKTNNYCNKQENTGPLANIAAAYMDLTIVNDVSIYFRQQPSLDFFASQVFPGRIPEKKPNKEKNEATETNAAPAPPT